MHAPPLRSLGPYLLQAELGRGGMGRVLSAVHAHTGEQVALKTVRTQSVAHRAALRREVRALAALDHPGIIRVLDEGVTDDEAWYAMPLLHAPTLAQAWSTVVQPEDATRTLDVAGGAAASALAQGGRDPEVWLPTLLGLCEALAHLHDHGLVHGDLKPSNVMLPPAERPVLVDFGLTARLGNREAAAGLSSAMARSGTPAYLPPERARGLAFDRRADLYALGCMLYELYAGRPPFLGSPEAQVHQHCHVTPVPVRDRAPGTPEPVCSLIERLLAKDAQDRPGHASEVAAVFGHTLPHARPQLFRPRVAGQAAAQDRLQQALAAACDGRGSALALRGAAGTGKTRLAIEAAGSAHSLGMQVISGECRPLDQASDEPLSAFENAVRLAVALAKEGGPEATRRTFGHGARLVAPWVPEVADLPGYAEQPALDLPPEVGRQALASLLVDLVLALAAQPLLLIVDDIHCADPLTREVLDRLAQVAPRHALAVVVTLRPSGRALEFAPVDLAPLDDDACSRMVHDMLGSPAPPDVLANIIRLAAGSPFLLGEAVRAALRLGALVHEGAAWRRGDAPLPHEAQDLLRERLQHRAPLEREVLSAACILGRHASIEHVAALIAAEPDEVLDATRRLHASELLAPQPNGSHAPTHAAVRHVVLSTVPAARQQALHLHAYTLLASRPGVARGEVARHLELAGQPVQARPLYLQAAEEALRLYALEEAERYYERARTGPRDEVACRATVALATQVWLHTGHADRALPLLEEVLPLADALDPALATKARSGLLSAHRLTGAYVQGLRVAEHASQLARARGDEESLASVLAEQARILTLQGEREAALALCARGLAMARSFDVQARLLRFQATTLWHLNRYDEAMDTARRLVEQARSHGTRFQQADARYVLAIIREEAGDLEGSGRGMAECAVEFAKLGARRLEALCRGNHAGLVLKREHPEQALEQLELAARTLQGLGDRRAATLTRLNLADLQMELGRFEAAQQTYAEAAGVLEAIGEGQLPRALVGLARAVRCGGGDPLEAARALDSALACRPSPADRVHALSERVVLAASQGQPAYAHLAELEAAWADIDRVAYLRAVVEEARSAAT